MATQGVLGLLWVSCLEHATMGERSFLYFVVQIPGMVNCVWGCISGKVWIMRANMRLWVCRTCFG